MHESPREATKHDYVYEPAIGKYIGRWRSDTPAPEDYDRLPDPRTSVFDDDAPHP